MRRIFLSVAGGLALASAALYWSLPERHSGPPVIYWISPEDANKHKIIAAFHQWLADQGLPDVDLRIDNTNQDPTKKLVQALAGVGADLFDLYGPQMDLFPRTGVLADVTEEAQQLGFSPEITYPALKPDFVVNGRQYAFPRNTSANLLWVNEATLNKYGLPALPARWTADEFEARGRRFVEAANPPGARQRAYFANAVPREVLRRGLGLGDFNETGTRCTLDDPRNAQVIERVRRWMLEDRLIPTREEDAAMSADLSGFNSMFSHFTSGRFAMIYAGQWAVMILRSRGTFQLSAVDPPVDGFPNTELGGGATVGIYAGSKHHREAVQFLQFLGSDAFNRLMLGLAESLPPVPRYAQMQEFLHPPGRENEWVANEAFVKATLETSLTLSRSPFVLQSVVQREETILFEAAIAGRLSPAEAAHAMAERINAEIALSVAADPKLKKLYAEQLATQQKIEELRAAGRPVPAAWVTDVFHKAYYRAHGWLEEEPKS